MSNVKKSLKEIVRDEYVKCANDPVHFMKKYCIIQHPMKGKIYFHLYAFQERTLHSLSKNRFNVILKSRQMGISTLTAGYALWCMLFKKDYNILVIATTQEVAKNLVTKVRVMHDSLPAWLKGTTVSDNKLSLSFKNGSQIKAVSSAGTAGRSEALSLLIIDEAAFISGIDEIWASAQSTLSTGGGAIVLSTPNGTGNFFHQTWAKSENGEQDDSGLTWNNIRLKWDLHPERDQTWRDQQTALLGEKMAAQECDCDFITSGHTVVDGPIIQWYQQTFAQEPLERRGPGGDLWIWDWPNYGKDYIVCADVARGDGGDYSAFHIIELENLKQVAEFKGKIGTTEYGNMLYGIAAEYNNALLCIENANVGWAVIQVVLDRGYPNLFYSYKQDGYIDENIHLRKGYDLKEKRDMVPGFSTTSKTRPLLISKLETYFREKSPIVHSKGLLNELDVFIWNGSRAEAQRGYNDDLVMSYAIGLWVRDTALKLKQQGLDLTKRALTSINKNQSIFTNKSIPTNARSQSEMRLTNGDTESLIWLM
jgi:hypothetical protein